MFSTAIDKKTIMNKYPMIFSFFAGCGFLDLGFELSGFNIAYVNEIYAPFIQAYRYARQCLNLPLPEYGYHELDIIKLTEGQGTLRFFSVLQDVRKNNNLVGFIGGPPCPDFSVGGKNRGSEGDNGKLSAAYIELICQQKPDFFLFENVKGLWKTKKHRIFFEELKYQLIQAGYLLVERLINAIEYGVPQDRDRIILIGFKQEIIKSMIGDRDQKYFDLAFPWERHILYSKDDVFAYSWPITNEFKENSILPYPDENIPNELTIEHWFQNNDVLNHPNSEHYFKPQAGMKRFMVVEEGDISRKSFKRLHRWRYSPTACYGNNEVHLHPYQVRRLSVAEALAIQSLPKNFVLPANMTLTNMFKTIGNGVPYLASKAIAQTIIDFLEKVQLVISSKC